MSNRNSHQEDFSNSMLFGGQISIFIVFLQAEKQ